jgi:hypothetical protein
MILIKNLPNTSHLTCECGSWLDHWEKFSQKKAHKCSAMLCTEVQNLVGAHVRKTGMPDSEVYIVPLCPHCHKRKDSFAVSSNTIFVSADPRKTCNKPKLK